MLRPNAVSVRIILYGIFLTVCGIVGFVLTAEQSTSALLNGVFGGVLMIILGIMHRQRRAFTLPAAIGAATIFTATFVWRSVVQWYHVYDNPRFVPVAILLSSMTVVSALLWAFLFRQVKR